MDDEVVYAVIVVVVLLLILLFVLHRRFARPDLVVVLFYADWCPACQAFQSEWQTVEQELAGEISTESVNVSNEKLMSERTREYGFDIPSIPTIVMVSNGKAEKYEGKRDAQSIIEYARSI